MGGGSVQSKFCAPRVVAMALEGFRYQKLMFHQGVGILNLVFLLDLRIASSNKCHATSNRCIASSNKKL